MQFDLESIARRLEVIAKETAEISQHLKAQIGQATNQPADAAPADSTEAVEPTASIAPTFEEQLAVTVAAARAKLITPELRKQLLAELAKLGVGRVSEANADQLKQIAAWIESQ